MRVLLDTNILTRYAEPAEAGHKSVTDAFAVLRTLGHEFCVVPQNYYEFCVVSTRPAANNGRGKTPVEVTAEFTAFKSLFMFLPDTPAVFPEWETLVSTYRVVGKPAHDARLVAAMIAHGVMYLLTFNDAGFRRYSGITPITPAAVVAAAGIS